MAAPKGHKRYGGRAKGTPNKNTVFSVSARLTEMGIDLIGNILADIALVQDPRDRTKLNLQLLEYCDAKRKALEVTAIDETQIERDRISKLPMSELKKLVKSKLEEDDK